MVCPTTGRLVPPTTHYQPFASVVFLTAAIPVLPRLQPANSHGGVSGLARRPQDRGEVEGRRDNEEREECPSRGPPCCLPASQDFQSPPRPQPLFKFLSLFRSSPPPPGTPLPAEGLNPSDQNLPANDTWLWLRQEVGACKSSK